MKFGALLPALLIGLAFGGAALARCENYVPQPKPQNVGRDIVGKSLDEIVERGFIEFAVFEDHRPWSYLEDGAPAGVDVEIGRLIAEYIGVEPRFTLVAAGENLDADLRNWVWRGPIVGGRVANVMLHVPYDSEFTCRVEQVVFTGLYHVEALAIAYDEAAYPDEPPLPAFFRFDPVGVENDSISDFYLSALAGGQLLPQIRRYPTTLAAMAALGAGEVKAVMGPRSELEAGLGDGLSLHEPPLPGLAKPEWTLATAIHHSYRPLAYTVEDAITGGIADGSIEAIFAAHGLTWRQPEW